MRRNIVDEGEHGDWLAALEILLHIRLLNPFSNSLDEDPRCVGMDGPG
jgi:hypothetical protein